RRTVTVQASALAPGRVPIEVEVTDPKGRALAEPAELRVRVSPPGLDLLGCRSRGARFRRLRHLAYRASSAHPAAPADPEDS
ncbi:hypothetical protein, partial [Janibacter melonis]|uniref:hypothetical protein n=1 Tax=Janibacter melonis TaxID=262209 RepID=UPI0020960254